MENSIKKLTSAEIEQLTNEIHDLANEVAMHGWDYRPLLRANQLLETYAVAPEPKRYIVRISTNSRYYDQDTRVKWNNCNLYPKPVPKNYEPGEHEKIIEAPTLGSAFDKMCELYCSDDTDMKLTAIGYFYLQNQNQ